ncbi:hypothetical protein BFP72_05155 [Reichenbachiella sp. 5M10]|uniref:hypothetical protein n=1 Tax=Reichenbachiella sp. 5M10 TaxID=1889772 RepID=UPI000C15232C|nr:hypothetical protein [Reichenbachiella sp. 5M10]PIB34834.1 hypothetical protein BFP72_05155 [Reichenbachiella sp. 5M10]
MRVFILCTGRSGSVAIIKACSHIKNFSASHESLSNQWAERRMDYPDQHIESDNRLSWQLGTLEKKFGDEAIYIHLTRDREKVAYSLLQRYYQPASIIDSFCEGIRMTPPEKLNIDQRMQACYDYVDTITDNIEVFLSNKTKTMNLALENIQEDFPKMWELIGAEGDMEAALAEFATPHNSSKKSARLNYLYRIKLLWVREWRHLFRNL